MVRRADTLLIQFDSKRIIAGNSALNGGVCQGIMTLFNHTIPRVEAAQDLPGGSVKEYLRKVALDNGIDPETSSGLLTAAKMQNSASEIISFRQLAVKAVVTAGVDVNGGRAGDPAAYFEEQGQFYSLTGTINIFLTINAHLPPHALLKGIITATEAKTAALQELMAPSIYSTGLATGSGTDGIIVAADPASRLRLTDAGLHSKLGEMIGCAVKKGVKKALALETGLSPQRQLNILVRLKRYEVDEEYLWRKARESYLFRNREEYLKILFSVAREPKVVALGVALIHLQDELEWGLLPQEQAVKAAFTILGAFHDNYSTSIISLLVDWLNSLVISKIKDNN